MPKKLSIIIPARNEENRIARTLRSYGTFFEDNQDQAKVEIIVVINGSTDRTAQIVDEYSLKYSFIKKIETKYKPGKGGAVSLGFSQAKGDYIGYFDADGAVSASEILKLYEFIDETPWLDGVVGTRVRSATKMSFRRRSLARLFNFYERLLFNLPYSDTQCAAKIFRRIPAREMAQKLSDTGWAFDVNLLLVAKYLNYRIIEQPVNWLEKEGSKFSWFVGFIRTPIELVRLKLLEISYHFEKGVGRFIQTRDGKPVRTILIYAWRDIKHPEMGGSEIYIHEIAKRLAKDYKVILFTSRPGNLNQRDVIDGVRIVRRGGFITVYLWAAIYYALYFRNTCDVIIDVENGLPFFTPLYSGKPKLLLIHHLHKGQWFNQFHSPIATVGYVLESFIMPIIYRTTKVITVSPSTLNEVVKAGFPEKSVFIAYNSIPPRTGAHYSRTTHPTLLYLGRIKAYKRIEVALETLKSIKSEFPKSRFIIGGNGDHIDVLRSYAAKLGILNDVEFLGFVSERKKWELYQKCWIFLMPSIKEGWGITIIEAASCGMPTIGFNVPGVRDSVVNNQTGLLADSVEDYYVKTRDMIKNSEMRSSMAGKCKGWAGNFSWDKSAAIFDRVIRQIHHPHLMSDKIYPWDLELKPESLTSLMNSK